MTQLALFETTTHPKGKPFLKWAGGKGQLLEQLTQHLPPTLKTGTLERYVEPFIGGGAMFFHLAHTYNIAEFVIGDINADLVLAYRTIRHNVGSLIDCLCQLEHDYHRLSPDAQKTFFYETRTTFNATRAAIDFDVYSAAWLERTAQLVFLNRTCYNGLYRVNSKLAFNVPFGRYKNPRICDADNLRIVAQVLERATILHGDFEACQQFVDADTFVYFDPPYRPLSATAHFTAYAGYRFDETAQIRLAQFYQRLDGCGAKLMLSNADPHNENPADNFFQTHYAGYHLSRVQANRAINSKASKRGQITELLITNYEI